MAFRGVTFAKQAVSSKDDAHIFNVLLNGRNGRTKGCKMSFSTDHVNIQPGYFFAAGRLIEITSTEQVVTPTNATGTTYCRLVFEIDLAQTNTNDKFNQGSFKVLSSTLDYPALTQENLDEGGNVFQLPFARFTKTINGTTNFVSELELIGRRSDEEIIYVAKSGASDFAGDGSSGSPYSTIAKALESIPHNLDNRTITINIATGTYAEDVVISGYYGGTLRIACGSVTMNSLSVYESCVIITGTALSLAASGKTYGFYVHRGANVICQLPLTVTGSSFGVYVTYGSSFSNKNPTTVNSCTYAVTSMHASYAYLASLTGSKNNNGVQAGGGIVSIDTVTAAMASTLYVTSGGGRIYTGAQANVPTN